VAKADALLAGADLLSCHILYRYSAHWVASRARRRGLPYWVVPHGCLDPYVFTYRAGIKRVWMRLFGRRILREATHVIFSTRREMEKASPWLTAGRANARVVPWPVELPALAGATELRSKGRERLGAAAGDTVFLYLGRLHSMKRPLETVEAFACAARPDAWLWIAGPDGEVKGGQVLARARELGVDSRVKWLGGVFGAVKAEVLAAADVYMSLSARENFNHSAVEMLAAGRPVILSPGNDLGPELAGCDIAWLLQTDEIAEAAAAMGAAADRGEAGRMAMGARGREWVGRELSFAKFADSLRALHAEACRRETSHTEDLRAEDGGRRAEGGGRRAEDGGRRTEGGGRLGLRYPRFKVCE
jgi:glycosyltransferase involved in cell wall biosynthesis